MIIERIRELETIARELEPDEKQRREIRDAVIDYSEEFLGLVESGNAYHADDGNRNELKDYPIEDDPVPLSQLIELIRSQVDSIGINPASGGHLGYIPGGGLFPSSLGDYLAAVSNRYSGIFFANP